MPKEDDTPSRSVDNLLKECLPEEDDASSRTVFNLTCTTLTDFFTRLLFGSKECLPEADDASSRIVVNLTCTMLTDVLTEVRQYASDLEDQLEILQRNHTSLADMVESQDALVDQLNNRVRVFEEDKFVIKAVL